MPKFFCKRPVLIKNKFISAFVATGGILMGLAFIFPMANFSVYLTSYIHEKQEFVTMHYGLFFNLIFTFSMSFGMSIGGFLELKLGFILTTLTGYVIILIANIFFLNVQNIWFCYVLTFCAATGAGISNSLVGKNLALYQPNKKGILISAIGGITVLFAGGFVITGEKIINPDGYTLGPTEEYCAYKYSSRTYLYFLLGFFSIPIGTLIFLLFIVEYKKEDESQIIEKNETTQNNEKEKKQEEIINESSTTEENDVLENNDENNKKENNEGEEKEENEFIEKELKTMNKKKNLKKVIKTFRFWRLAFIQLFITFAFSFILGTGRTFGALIGIDGSALQFLMLCQSGALIIVGPIFGFIVDKRGPLNLLRIASLVCMVPGILLTFFIENTIIFISSFIISVLALVAIMVCFVPFIMEVYGIQESVIIGGIMNIFAKLSEVITTVSAFVISFYYTKDEIEKLYKVMYLIGSGLCFLSFILLIFEHNKKHDYEQNDEDLGNLVEKGRFTVVSV